MNPRSTALIAARLAIVAAACSCAPPPPRDGGLDAADDAADDARDELAGDAREPDGAASPTVALATGQSELEELSPTAPQVELIYGAQGGYHVWGRARFTGFAPDVDVWFEALELPSLRPLHTPVVGRRWIENGLRRGLQLAPGGFATEAELVVLNIRCTAEVLGRSLRMTAHVRERATGREVSATRDVRVIDELPSPACAPGPSG